MRILINSSDPHITEATCNGLATADNLTLSNDIKTLPWHAGLLLPTLRHTDFSVLILGFADVAPEHIKLIKAVRTVTSTPILVLLQEHNEEFEISCFQAAQEHINCIDPPFSGRRMLAYLDVLTRNYATVRPEVLRFRDMELEIETQTFKINGIVVPLGRTQFDVMKLFMKRPRVWRSREKIMQTIKGVGDTEWDERQADSHIKRLRTRVQSFIGGRRFGVIESMSRLGYRLCQES